MHAVAHVLDLTNRIDDGVDWLTSTAPCWSSDNFFAVHNWWHLVPYHFDRLQWNQVLRLYGTRRRGHPIRSPNPSMSSHCMSFPGRVWPARCHMAQRLHAAAAAQAALPVRLACLFLPNAPLTGAAWQARRALETLCHRLRVPGD